MRNQVVWRGVPSSWASIRVTYAEVFAKKRTSVVFSLRKDKAATKFFAYPTPVPDSILAMLLALGALVTIFCGLVSVLLLYNHWRAVRADRCPQANERKVLLWLEEKGLRLPHPEEILALLQPSMKKLQPDEEGIVSCVRGRTYTYVWPTCLVRKTTKSSMAK